MMRAPVLGLLAATLVAACANDPPFTDDEWAMLKTLSPLGDAPPDHSNAYVGNAAAEALGQKFYFDAAFSGKVLQQDMLHRDIPYARRPAGQEASISCATCHDPARGGADFTSNPLNVSIGGGAYDVNGQQTLNAAYHRLLYWNGRNDSLWSQIVAVGESEVSMTGDRMKVAWRIADAYRADYLAVFGDKYPLPPEMDSIANQEARLLPDGTCPPLGDGTCPPECWKPNMNQPCLPRFPLRGKPGYDGLPGMGLSSGVVPEGTQLACQRGDTTLFPAEPFDDAYDCMQATDQRAVTRIYVNWAKAIAAYEYKLVSRDSGFDKFVAEGHDSDTISPEAKRGAKLFVGKAACIDCHNTPLFADGEYHNIGVPQTGAFVPTVEECPEHGWCDCVSGDINEAQNCIPAGYREGIRRLQANTFRRDSLWSDDETCAAHFADHIDPEYVAARPDECDGRAAAYAELITLGDAAKKSELVGRWRTPSLRDVALTAPYMHDGLYTTLDDVVWHYNRGGSSAGAVGAKDPRLRPLLLTDTEMSELVAFLQTLTGAPLPPTLVTAPAGIPPP